MCKVIYGNSNSFVRTTQDVDCLVLVPAIQYQRLADELAATGCVLRDESGDEQPITVAAMRQQERERKLIELWQGEARAELFLPFLPLQDEILRRAVRLPFENRTNCVTTAEDLVLLKMVFHREKDLIVAGIRRASRPAAVARGRAGCRAVGRRVGAGARRPDAGPPDAAPGRECGSGRAACGVVPTA